MIGHMCGGVYAPWEPEEPPEGWVPCCMAGAMNGPQGCSCWVPVYDLEQQPPNVFDAPEIRTEMCVDCAFRPGSPERSDETEQEHLLSLPSSGAAFYCHQGVRRVIEWRHPDGRSHPGDPRDYRPPQVHDAGYKADGNCMDICAGWAALAAREGRL